MTFNEILGSKILELRNKNKLNQNEFCNMLDINITRGSISRIEKGTQTPSVRIIKSIIESFNISPYWLLDIQEPKIDNNITKYDSLGKKDKEIINLLINHLSSNSTKDENKKSP